jgi:hypothetical protein
MIGGHYYSDHNGKEIEVNDRLLEILGKKCK